MDEGIERWRRNRKGEARKEVIGEPRRRDRRIDVHQAHT